LKDLVGHYSIKGSLKNLRNGMEEMQKKNQKIDVNVLTAFDFAGRDLKVEIAKAEARNWEFRFD
jgi:hypothetical protein